MNLSSMLDTAKYPHKEKFHHMYNLSIVYKFLQFRERHIRYKIEPEKKNLLPFFLEEKTQIVTFFLQFHFKNVYKYLGFGIIFRNLRTKVRNRLEDLMYICRRSKILIVSNPYWIGKLYIFCFLQIYLK